MPGIDYAPEPSIHDLNTRILNLEATVVALKDELKPHVDRANEKLAAEKADAEAAIEPVAEWNPPPPNAYQPYPLTPPPTSQTPPATDQAEPKAVSGWGTAKAAPPSDLPPVP
jgi:hypothetical protein